MDNSAIERVSTTNGLTFEETKNIFLEVFKEIANESKDEILTPDEAAEVLKLNDGNAVKNAFNSGEIPGFKSRGKIFFVRSELLENAKSKSQFVSKSSVSSSGIEGISALARLRKKKVGTGGR
jgi:hypothetical protein